MVPRSAARRRHRPFAPAFAACCHCLARRPTPRGALQPRAGPRRDRPPADSAPRAAADAPIAGPSASRATSCLLIPSDNRMACSGRRTPASRQGRLTDLNEIAVRITDVAADLGFMLLGRGQELCPPPAPFRVDGLNVGNPDVEEAADKIRVTG